MGSNNKNSASIQEGFKMIGNLTDMFSGKSPGTEIDSSGDHEEMAQMAEFDARERALAEEKLAEKKAEDVHVKQEQDRSKRNTEWGQSGLAMSGSKELVRESRQLKDRQDEEDELFEGDMETRETMDKGMREANLFRISRGIAPTRSTLSLGSEPYKYRR